MEEDEVDDELSEAADTEVIKQFALMLSPGRPVGCAATLSAMSEQIEDPNVFDSVKII